MLDNDYHNMPLYVTEYLKDDESHVGYLASLCAA